MSSELDDIGAVFAELVNQFADPMAFFRELIQNSIDAGSQQIDVWFETEAVEAKGQVMLIAHIDDFGVGMTQEIVETKLTRLFSSTKDDDFTKIGRFGIGFVSVFSINPDVVVVDTARDGEAWRVLFHPDRTFDLIRLDEPLEGTQIRVIKTMSVQEAEEFQERAHKVIQKWCRHVAVPINFEGEDVREPFEVDATVSVSFEEEGTRIIAGFVKDEGAIDFYNRGLTLMEGPSRWHGVSVKVDSRYLEHTLTRDRVLEDRHYQKAISSVEDLVLKRLPAALVARVEESAAARSSDYSDLLEILLGALRTQLVDLSAIKKRNLIPLLNGEVISVNEAIRAHRKKNLYVFSDGDHIPSDDTSFQVVGVAATPPIRRFMDWICEQGVPYLEEHWVRAREVDVSLVVGAAELMNNLRHLLKTMHMSPDWIGYGDLKYTHCPLASEVAIGVPNALEPVLVTEVLDTFETKLNHLPHVVVNISEPRVATLVKLAAKEPEFAAMQLFKSMVVVGGLSEQAADTVLRYSHQRRQQRVGAK